MVVVLNFSADAQTVKLALPEAELTPAMGGFDVTGWEAGQEMAPYSYAVLPRILSWARTRLRMRCKFGTWN